MPTGHFIYRNDPQSHCQLPRQLQRDGTVWECECGRRFEYHNLYWQPIDPKLADLYFAGTVSLPLHKSVDPVLEKIAEEDEEVAWESRVATIHSRLRQLDPSPTWTASFTSIVKNKFGIIRTLLFTAGIAMTISSVPLVIWTELNVYMASALLGIGAGTSLITKVIYEPKEYGDPTVLSYPHYLPTSSAMIQLAEELLDIVPEEAQSRLDQLARDYPDQFEKRI